MNLLSGKLLKDIYRFLLKYEKEAYIATVRYKYIRGHITYLFLSHNIIKIVSAVLKIKKLSGIIYLYKNQRWK